MSWSWNVVPLPVEYGTDGYIEGNILLGYRKGHVTVNTCCVHRNLEGRMRLKPCFHCVIALDYAQRFLSVMMFRVVHRTTAVLSLFLVAFVLQSSLSLAHAADADKKAFVEQMLPTVSTDKTAATTQTRTLYGQFFDAKNACSAKKEILDCLIENPLPASEADAYLTLVNKMMMDEGKNITKDTAKNVAIKEKMNKLAVLKGFFLQVKTAINGNPLLFDTAYPKKDRLLFKKLGLREVLGEGTYDFRDNADYRKTNIRNSIVNADNFTIEPGAEFDFWKVMYANGLPGMVEGWATIDGKEVLTVGGGICGTSTAIFRAAWFSGLEITERRNHTIYYSDLYAMKDIGLDSSVYEYTPNLRFKNNTGSRIMIYVLYNETRDLIRVQMLGTKHFKDMSFGKLVKKDDTTFTRSRAITYTDGRTKEEVIKSTYKKITSMKSSNVGKK